MVTVPGTALACTHLIGSNEEPTDQLLLERCRMLEGQEINMDYTTMGKAIVSRAPYVPGYGVTHITIAYFPNGVPKVLGTSLEDL